MSRLVVSEFVTVDGVFEDPGGAEGSPYGGWGAAARLEPAGRRDRDPDLRREGVA